MKHILKEEKTMKKILALVLCLALALGMIPAFAEEAAAEKSRSLHRLRKRRLERFLLE